MGGVYEWNMIESYSLEVKSFGWILVAFWRLKQETDMGWREADCPVGCRGGCCSRGLFFVNRRAGKLSVGE